MHYLPRTMGFVYSAGFTLRHISHILKVIRSFQRRSFVKRILLYILVGAVFISGCAPKLIPRADTNKPRLVYIKIDEDKPDDVKICAESPFKTAHAFIEGIMDFNLERIRKLIAKGLTLLGVFGDGDEKKGKKNAEEFYYHPEKLMGKDVGSTFELMLPMKKNGENSYEILIERYSEIREKKAGGEEHTTEAYEERRFFASFEPNGNCLTDVRAIDPAWMPKQTK